MDSRFVRCCLSGCLTLVLSIASVSEASAQMTPQALLATSVERFDATEYADVVRAVADFNAGNVEQAREQLVAAAERHVELPPVDVLMALLHFSANQRAEGEAALDRAIVDHPDDPEAFIILADLAMSERHAAVSQLGYDRAQAAMDEFEGNAWRKRVLQIRISAGMASLEETRGRHAKAVAHLQRWARLDAENPLVHGSLGREWFRSGDYDEARAAFARLLEIQPDAPPVEIAMGRLYSDAGMQEQALTSMRDAVAQQGDDIRTRLTVAEWAVERGLIDLARTNVDAALALEADSVGVRVLQARIARLESDLGAAESILTAAILKYPNSFAVANELARTLALSDDAGKRQSALEYARRNHRIAQDRTSGAGREAILTYAWLLLKNDQAEQAETVLHTLPDGSPVSSENAYYAGAIYAARNRLQLATQTLRAALAGDVAFPERAAAERLLEDLQTASATR